VPGHATAVVADSTVCLPPSLTRGLPLFIAPLEIHHAGRVLRDGIDITPDGFYDLLKSAEGALPRTSAPPPGAYLSAFQQASRVARDIVCLTVSAKLSSSHAAALTAAREAGASMPDLRIQVVDSGTAGAAEGLIALQAARQAAAGAAGAAVLACARAAVSEVWLLGYLETLYYIWKGGRVPRVAMWMGRLLDVKPVLELTEGKVGMVERPRSRRRAIDRLVAMSSARLRGRRARVAVMHAAAPEPAAELAGRISRELSPIELFTTEMTPVIGAHTGTGLVACALLPEA